MRTKTRLTGILLIAVIAAMFIIANAGNTGKIKGHVFDAKTGDPIPGASVQIDGTSLGAMTDPDGSFLIQIVPPGKYTLRVTAISYERKEIEAVSVLADRTTEVTIELKGSAAELDKVIRVTAHREVIDRYQVSSCLSLPSNNNTNQPPPAHGGSAIVNGEAYDAMFFKDYGTNPFVDTEDDHLSTFAIDVDDASFVMTRSYLDRGHLPPDEAVRTEEFINHFDYNYKGSHTRPFTVDIEGAPSYFGENCELLKIGIQGREIYDEERKPANLVFVIDVSGSMNRENRLGLVKRTLTALVDHLRSDDRVGIVVYGSRGEIVLEMTSIRDEERIYEAINSVSPGGSTNAEEGIRLGYQMADRNFDRRKINRVILCSDGVANVGRTGPEDLLKQIKRYAHSGITLTTVGFGMGNYNDVLMEKLGNKGNGMYAYVDSYDEARRVFLENLTGMLQVIARDVKIQVDFNPDLVRSYRLIGYENRDVADNKFRDDREDGGEIGSGHQVTALYEVKFHKHSRSRDVGTIFIRFKDPEGDHVDEISRQISKTDFHRSFMQASDNFKLAAAAAEFGEILGKSYWAKDGDLDSVLRLIEKINRDDYNDEVAEFMEMVRKAQGLQDELADH